MRDEAATFSELKTQSKMHPDLDDFLESAFRSVQPVSPAIGRVVVEPDYDVAPDPRDVSELTNQLTECLRSHTVPGDVEIDSKHPLLKKYLRRISLHADKVDGSWVEVEPPGNWI